jgi:hypothetical protein
MVCLRNISVNTVHKRGDDDDDDDDDNRYRFSWSLFPLVLTTVYFYGGAVSLTPNPQRGGSVYHILCGSSPLTCLALGPLPVATIPPA